MKPVLLTIEGLQSFREPQTIRFDELSDAGVFGIFGPTGSGKSTILDAITLALYGTVWRADRGTHGIMNHAEKNLTVTYQFQIGVGIERKTIRVERSYKRTSEYTVGHKASRLLELDANGEPLFLLEGKGEVTQKVQELLGLESKDFFKAVVLPQGQFADFLKLTGSERRAMLQKLFALERYGKQLGERLKSRLYRVKGEIDRIHNQQTGMGDCSQEAVLKAAAYFAEAKEQERTAVAAFNALTKEFETKKKLVELQTELQEIENQLAELSAKTPEINRLAEKVAVAEQANLVYPLVTSCRQQESEFLTLEDERKSLATTEEALRTESVEAERTYATAQTVRAQKYPGLIEQKTNLNQALQWENELRQLQEKVIELEQQLREGRIQYETAANQIRELTNKQEALKVELEAEKLRLEQNTVPTDYRNKLSNALQKKDQYQTVLIDLQKVEQDLNNRQSDLDGALRDQEAATDIQKTLADQTDKQQQLLNELKSNPPADESLLNQHDIQLAETKGNIDRIQRLEKNEANNQQRLLSMESSKGNLTSQLDDLQGKLLAAKDTVNHLRQSQQDLFRQNKQAMALQLAKDLHTGEACLVCGSHEHPNPAKLTDSEADFHQDLEKVQIHLEQAEALVSNLQSEELHLRAEISAKEAEIQGIQQELKSDVEEKSSLLELLRSVLSLNEGLAESAEPIADQLSSLFDNEKQQVAEKRRETEEWKTRCATAELDWQQLKENLANHQSTMAALEQRIASARTELVTAQEALQQKQELLEASHSNLQDALTALGCEDLEQLQIELNKKDEEYEHAKIRAAQFELDREQIQKHMILATTTENECKVLIAGLETSLQENKKRLGAIESDIQQVTSGIPVQKLLNQVESQIQQLEQNELAAKERMESTKRALEEISKRLIEVTGRFQLLSESLEKVREEMEAKLVEFGFVTPEQVEDSLQTAEETSDAKQQIQVHNDQLKLRLSEKEKRETQLNGQFVAPEEWQETQDKLTAAESASKEAAENRAVVQAKYQELQAKNVVWEHLEQDKAEYSKQEGHLNHLKSLLAGDKFVEFLSQEQMEVVARQASDRLKRLTRNRYALEVAPDGGFLMRDDANGGVRRPVSTLSGGETFLTSLALALSLSTQIQLRGKYPLEFFFLDEGFGTLDADLLDVVMATLEQLQVENMTIGVISHVPELQQRLHRRLIVEPAEAAGRGTLVRMERM